MTRGEQEREGKQREDEWLVRCKVYCTRERVGRGAISKWARSLPVACGRQRRSEEGFRCFHFDTQMRQHAAAPACWEAAVHLCKSSSAICIPREHCVCRSRMKGRQTASGLVCSTRDDIGRAPCASSSRPFRLAFPCERPRLAVTERQLRSSHSHAIAWVCSADCVQRVSMCRRCSPSLSCPRRAATWPPTMSASTPAGARAKARAVHRRPLTRATRDKPSTRPVRAPKHHSLDR